MIEKLVELPGRIPFYQMWRITRKIIRKIGKKDLFKCEKTYHTRLNSTSNKWQRRFRKKKFQCF